MPVRASTSTENLSVHVQSVLQIWDFADYPTLCDSTRIAWTRSCNCKTQEKTTMANTSSQLFFYSGFPAKIA
jgi:hypothetical protein